MKKIYYLIAMLLIAAACSSSGKYPLDIPSPKPSPDPEPNPVQQDTIPDKPNEIVFAETNFSQSFKEDFSQRIPSAVELSQRLSDFRYFSAFPSIIEKGTSILLLRLDPTDAAGFGNGSKLAAPDYCTYGSYSARLRVPDTKTVQKTLDASAVLSLYDEDEKYGLRNISMEIKLSDPSSIYLKSQGAETKVTPSGFNASSAFKTIGFDWYKDKIVWWVSSGSAKTTVYETSVADDIPAIPAHFRFAFHHLTTAGAPKYPYELELDWIAYEAFSE